MKKLIRQIILVVFMLMNFCGQFLFQCFFSTRIVLLIDVVLINYTTRYHYFSGRDTPRYLLLKVQFFSTDRRIGVRRETRPTSRSTKVLNQAAASRHQDM